MTSTNDPWVALMRQRVETMSLRKIAEINDDGPAAIEGTAVARGLLASPLSGVSVIGYRIVIEAEGHDGPQRQVDISRALDFDLQDDAGDRILIKPMGARLILQYEYSMDSDEAGSLGFLAQQLLAEHVEPSFFRGAEPKLRWHEYFLQPGERTYVAGDVRMVIDPTREAVTYRENAREPTLVAPRDAKTSLIVADLPRASLLAFLDAVASG